MNNKPNMGKQVKDLGVLIIIVGIIMAALVIFGLATSNTQSLFYYLANEYFPFLVIGALVCFLVGVIVRSIGKSKEMKYMQNNPQMYYGQPGFAPQQPYNPQYTQQNPNNQQSNGYPPHNPNNR